MPVEQREQAIAFESGSTGNGRSPVSNGRRQPSRGGTSRMTRECQVRICEGLGVKFPEPTRQKCPKRLRLLVYPRVHGPDRAKRRPSHAGPRRKPSWSHDVASTGGDDRAARPQTVALRPLTPLDMRLRMMSLSLVLRSQQAPGIVSFDGCYCYSLWLSLVKQCRPH
jgi:hypothetical protein